MEENKDPHQEEVKVHPKEISEDTKAIITVLLLIFCFPIGLILMWLWTRWPLWVKVLISIPVMIIGFFVLLFLLPLLTALLSPSNPNEPVESTQSQTPREKISSEILNVYETDQFSFYYPKNYEKSNVSTSEKLIYQDKNIIPLYKDSGLGMTLFINIDTGPNILADKVDLTFCQKIVNASKKSVNDKILNVNVIKENNFFGCEYTITSPIQSAKINDEITYHEKSLIPSNSKTLRMYTVRAQYFGSQDTNSKQILDLAVNSFTLK